MLNTKYTFTTPSFALLPQRHTHSATKAHSFCYKGTLILLQRHTHCHKGTLTATKAHSFCHKGTLTATKAHSLPPWAKHITPQRQNNAMFPHTTSIITVEWSYTLTYKSPKSSKDSSLSNHNSHSVLYCLTIIP